MSDCNDEGYTRDDMTTVRPVMVKGRGRTLRADRRHYSYSVRLLNTCRTGSFGSNAVLRCNAFSADTLTSVEVCFGTRLIATVN